MLVWDGIEEPLDVFLGANNAWKSQNLDRGIIGMYAHIHVAFFACRHDGLEEVFHVFAQLLLVDAFVEVEEFAEFLNGCFVVLAEVTTDKALRLDHDILHELMILLGCHRLGQFVAFSQYVASLADAFRELECSPFLACTLTLQDIDVEVGKLGIVEVEVGCTIGVGVEQVGTCPVENRHEVVTYAVNAFCRQVAQRLFVDLNLVVTIGAAILNGLNDRQRLYNTPSHAIALDVFTQVAYLFAGPYLAERNVV